MLKDEIGTKNKKPKRIQLKEEILKRKRKRIKRARPSWSTLKSLDLTSYLT
jgi:hypothetical protein